VVARILKVFAALSTLTHST